MGRERRRLGAGIVVLAATLATFAAVPSYARAPLQPHKASVPAAPEAARSVPGRLVVELRPGTAMAVRAALHRSAGGRVVARIAPLRVELVRVPAGHERAALARYRADPAVRSAARDTLVDLHHASCPGNPACLVPDDPLFRYQWGLQNDEATTQPSGSSPVAGADIAAPLAWRQSRSSADVQIAVIDSGVDRDHPDLAGKVVHSATLSGNASTDDLVGHGTSVAGVAAAATGNGIGIAGAGWDATVMNVKAASDSAEGTITCGALAQGIVYATDRGARVINMSLGTANPCSSLAGAVEYAWARDRVLIASSGNDGTSDPRYPAAYPNVVAVSATDNGDRRGSFAGWGAEWVDLAAPGVSVATTLSEEAGTPAGSYGARTGTSFAAPFASGAAALLWPATPDANGDGFRSDDVVARLFSGADPIAGTGTLWRHGRLNACRALAAGAQRCPPPPGGQQQEPPPGGSTGTSGGTTTGTPTAPTATAPLRLTRRAAVRAARRGLAATSRTRWTRGRARRLTCRRASRVRFRCRVSWRRGARRYSGTVTVRLRAPTRIAVSVRLRGR